MADPDASARIFISYRREDSSGHVLALLPALRKHFGNRIFKDTDNIPPGEDFVKFINGELQSCSVLLAIIGKDWLTVRDPRLRTRRLDNPDDCASDLIDQALALDPNLEPALALRNRLLALRRERERGRERARVAAGAVDRARARLDEQKFESAVRHADDALSLDPQSIQAREIREKASASLDDRPRRLDTPGTGSFRHRGLAGGGCGDPRPRDLVLDLLPWLAFKSACSIRSLRQCSIGAATDG